MSRREDKKKPEITAESSLAPQLGSNPALMARTGEFDIRKHTKINDIIAFCAAYFRRLPDEEGGEFARNFFDDLLHLSTSIDGWNVNKEIQMVAGSKGVGSVGELVKKPGIIQRNVTNRAWKKQADEEGKTVVE